MMTQSDEDERFLENVHQHLVSELESLVDRAQTRDEHVRATSALALARQARDQISTVSGSASRRTSDQRP